MDLKNYNLDARQSVGVGSGRPFDQALLRQLAQTGTSLEKVLVASLAHTDPGTLDLLAESDDEAVLLQIAANSSSSPASLFAVFAKFPKFGYSLVENPASPSGLLDLIAQAASDHRIHDRILVHRNGRNNPFAHLENYPSDLDWLAADRALDPEHLLVLSARFCTAQVRANLIRNRS